MNQKGEVKPFASYHTTIPLPEIIEYYTYFMLGNLGPFSSLQNMYVMHYSMYCSWSYMYLKIESGHSRNQRISLTMDAYFYFRENQKKGSATETGKTSKLNKNLVLLFLLLIFHALKNRVPDYSLNFQDSIG